MAKTWFSVSVELLGGRGEGLWPRPGRIFAVGPSHTFEQLADAINTAFARWDRSHLSVFNLADGSVVTDPYNGPELTNSMQGPIEEFVDFTKAKVSKFVKPGAEFQFTFDLGDGWTHLCRVGPMKVDPLDTLGIIPAEPLPYWGWGTIPDQHGRRTADDDGETEVPDEPAQPPPMLGNRWPNEEDLPLVDIRGVRAATATGDAKTYLQALTGCHIDDALQQAAAGMPMALGKRRKQAESIALSFINHLTWRRFRGDQVLADALLAHLRDQTEPELGMRVDVELMSVFAEGNEFDTGGGYIDLRTGEVYPAVSADPATVGAEDAIDLEAEPDRWLEFPSERTHDSWEDMRDFAGRIRDEQLRDRLQNAIEGRGAFKRFKDAIAEAGRTDRWQLFSEDRKLGRAREFLAENGIPVV